MTQTTERPNVSYGDKEIAEDNEILRCVVGSGVHGIAIEGTDDHDEMGVFIEPPAYCIGTKAPFEHRVERTVPEGVRSGPGDTDLTIYSLRRWMGLALHGNPTVLLPLFAPLDDLIVTTPLGFELRSLSDKICSVVAGKRFLGYLHNQRDRMLGGGTHRSKVPNRPELIEKYGFDVKYASHALRLGFQGIELLTTGSLTLPMRDDLRDRILAVKRGEVPFEECVSIIDGQAKALVRLIENPSISPLPEHPDYDAIDQWMTKAHTMWWAENSLV
jgi:hypothetical protein